MKRHIQWGLEILSTGAIVPVGLGVATAPVPGMFLFTNLFKCCTLGILWRLCYLGILINPITNKLVFVVTTPISQGKRETWCQQPRPDTQWPGGDRVRAGRNLKNECVPSNLNIQKPRFREAEARLPKLPLQLVHIRQRLYSNPVVLSKSVCSGTVSVNKLVILLIVRMTI